MLEDKETSELLFFVKDSASRHLEEAPEDVLAEVRLLSIKEYRELIEEVITMGIW
ncbi:MAG: hypothetical protein ACLTS6_16835 [Anaerobutyricum sp.]